MEELAYSPDKVTGTLRIPPHSIEAEQSVLGGLMLDNEAWDPVADRVSEQDFYRSDHRLIFRAIAALANEGKPYDIVTLSEWLVANNLLEKAGGLVYLALLAETTPSAANIAAYADIVRERSVLRQLICVGTEIGNSAYHTEGRTSEQLLDQAEQLVFEIADQQARERRGFKPIKELLTKALARIDTLFQQDSPITGVATGFTDFDQLTAGLQPSDLIIVAGRPSMGKTAFAMSITEQATIKEGHVIAIFSMEMPGEQVAMRLMSSLGRIDQHKIRTGKLSDDDWPRLTSAIGILSSAKMFIDDTPALTPGELRARCRRIAREHGLGLVIIDYLQLMQVPGTKENRATEISEISRSLKSLAKELNVPIVALSQLNRSLEQREDKRPRMADLRECVTGDTLVVLADGCRVPISQLIGKTPEVLAVDANGRLCVATSDKVWSVGKKPVFRITLASGREIRATAQHRLYGANGWYRVEEMQVGNRLAISRRLPEPGQPEVWPDKQVALEQSTGDLLWDRIMAIEPSGYEDAYDMTVPGPASWLADGIVSHNSGAIEQDADVIVFIYRDEVYHEDSPDKGVAEIIVSKQRNGPIGTVRLTFLGQFTRFENFIAADNYSASRNYG